VKTAIDSSVLHAVFNNESSADSWIEKLILARRKGPLIICDVVYAELSPGFSSASDLDGKLADLGIAFDPIDPDAAFLAGQLFGRYREAGGPRIALIPDFLIGAHAQIQADRLAAIDSGFRRKYFSDLLLLTI
jgi:predicted nucleic acid-binding protein